MHIHLPQPAHGWRAFVGEVAIIVLGVAIALAGEQLVEEWRWHQKVAVVRTSIMGELANDRARWEADMAGASCALKTIDKLDRWAADGAASTTTPDASGLRDQLSFFWMHSANWDLATASQAMDHFPIDEQLALSALYDGIVHREVELEREGALTQRVQTFVLLAKDAQQRRELRAALGSLRSNIGGLIDENEYMRRHFDAAGVTPNRSDFGSDYSGNGCVN